MPKPTSKKSSKIANVTTNAPKRRRTRKLARPNFCKYCTAKLPRDGRKFCNIKHEKAFK